MLSLKRAGCRRVWKQGANSRQQHRVRLCWKHAPARAARRFSTTMHTSLHPHAGLQLTHHDVCYTPPHVPQFRIQTSTRTARDGKHWPTRVTRPSASMHVVAREVHVILCAAEVEVHHRAPFTPSPTPVVLSFGASTEDDTVHHFGG